MAHETDQIGDKLLYADEVFRIQGAVYEVNRVLGGGFLEAMYQECLGLEFTSRDIPFAAQRPIPLLYKGAVLSRTYVPDFVCFGKIVIELKAASDLLPEHKAQVINYLRASRLRLGLLINFSPRSKAQIERVAL